VCQSPRAPMGSRAMAVIAATDGGSIVSLNNFHGLRDKLLSQLTLN